MSTLPELVREPIRPDAPTGDDVAYDDAFLALKTQIDILGGAGGTVDYGEIIGLATQILTESSKDLATACYLSVGLADQKGVEGVAEAIETVVALCDAFWDDLYPIARRMRARRNVLQFLVERSADHIKRAELTQNDRPAVVRISEATEVLGAFVTEKMGDDAPALGTLRRELKEALRKLPEPTPEPGPTPDAPPGEAAPTAADGTPGAAPSTTPRPASGAPVASGPVESPKEAYRALVQTAGALRGLEPLSAVALGVTRAVRWGALAGPPPAEGGTTKIPPPPEARRTFLLGLAGQPDVLAREGEVSFQQPPFQFWLDLQRLQAGALGALGAPARPALAALEAAAGALHRRVPGLAALRFSDGTPFADRMTQEWLAELAAAGDESGGGASSTSDDEVLAEAKAAAGAGELPAALALLEGPASSARQRFARRLLAAELCLGANPGVAAPLLDALAAEAEAHALDAWEPALALDVARLRHAAHAALAKTTKGPAQQAHATAAVEAHATVCRLGPARALGL